VSRSRLADLAAGPLVLLGLILSPLPISWVQALGRVLGAIWYHVLPIRRRVVARNLALALPDVPLARRRAIARGTFAHVATVVLELLWSSRRTPVQLGRLVEVHGLDRYRVVREQGRGVVAATAHLGNWDLLGCSQAGAGVPLTIVTKTLSSPRIDRLWNRSRLASGLRLAAASGSIAQVIRSLRRGEVVGLVVDQRCPASEGGVRLPFFGHAAWTTIAPAVLAARTGAAILPVMTFRRRDGTHVVLVGEEIERRATAPATMAHVNSILERWIRNHPDQWLWLHRRWRQ